MKRRAFLLGTVAAALFAREAAAAYLPLVRPMLNALDYNIAGDGVTNDAAAIQTFINLASAQGAIAFFPGAKTYNLGGLSLTVPDSTIVMCAENATILRSSDPANPLVAYGTYTGSMISLGNHCRWSGGILTNSTVLGTSITSQAIATGSITFATQAALPLTGGSSFVRIWSRANPANKFEGVVASYSGTSLVLTASFTGGTGTHTDWNITIGSIYQAPMVLHGVTESIVENVRVTGNWYVGLLMDGWNPSTGGSLLTNFCTFRNCYLENVQNRGLYLYGSCSDNLVDGCYVQGSFGITDYGYNANPANAVGAVNFQLRNKVMLTDVNTTAFQGFEIGDQSLYNLIEGCTANGLTDATGVGFLVQTANGQTPQYNRIVGCVANNCLANGFMFVGALFGGADSCSAVVCGQGYLIAPSGSVQSSNVSINGSEALSSTAIGFNIAGNSSRCDLNGIKAINNGTTGVNIQTGAVRTLVTGRAFNNTGANLVDGGTSSVTTGLTVA